MNLIMTWVMMIFRQEEAVGRTLVLIHHFQSKYIECQGQDYMSCMNHQPMLSRDV